MTNAAKIFRGLLVLAVAAGLGTFIGWLVSRQGDVTPVAVSAAPVQPQAYTSTPVQPPVQSAPAVAETPVAEPVPPADAISGWEQKLDDILLTGDDENTKADKILALIPTAPPDAQVELSQHLVNMVQDSHYDGTAQLLTNSTTPSAVSTVLMNDLLNRDNTLKLPMLLAVARNDDHPLKDQAREMLELLTQEDNGTNWDQWSTSIDTWLQNNPQ
jgi:hypothetical protein